jgi:hypothetical protein
MFSPTTPGFFREKINAREIKGREDARKIGPFFNDSKELMSWVNWGTKKNSTKIKPYFRRYGDGIHNIRQIKKKLEEEKKDADKLKDKSIHKRTQKILKRALEQLLRENRPIRWSFKDPRLTDFFLSGDLLSNVSTVEEEFRIFPPFTNYYSLDIALLGDKICNKPIILGAIEIEYTHEVDLLKTLLCKSLGFPLFTININDVSYGEITEEWCIKRLLETTCNSKDNRRRNYVYIHNMLYPVYLSGYESWDVGEKHQYIIFIRDDDSKKLVRYVDTLKASLSLSEDDVKLKTERKNPRDKGSITMFENEGALTGDNWKNYNPNKFFRLILKRPKRKSGNIYKFHLVLAQLLALHLDCLVGYKFDIGISNFKKDIPIWELTKIERNLSTMPKFIQHSKRFCPKRLSEPIREIMRYIS